MGRRQHLPDGQGRDLVRQPSVLHRHDEDHRHRRPRRALRASLRRPPQEVASTYSVEPDHARRGLHEARPARRSFAITSNAPTRHHGDRLRCPGRGADDGTRPGSTCRPTRPVRSGRRSPWPQRAGCTSRCTSSSTTTAAIAALPCRPAAPQPTCGGSTADRCARRRRRRGRSTIGAAAGRRRARCAMLRDAGARSRGRARRDQSARSAVVGGRGRARRRRAGPSRRSVSGRFDQEATELLHGRSARPRRWRNAIDEVRVHRHRTAEAPSGQPTGARAVVALAGDRRPVDRRPRAPRSHRPVRAAREPALTRCPRRRSGRRRRRTRARRVHGGRRPRPRPVAADLDRREAARRVVFALPARDHPRCCNGESGRSNCGARPRFVAVEGDWPTCVGSVTAVVTARAG